MKLRELRDAERFQGQIKEVSWHENVFKFQLFQERIPVKSNILDQFLKGASQSVSSRNLIFTKTEGQPGLSHFNKRMREANV
jgi:hypothetical protein